MDEEHPLNPRSPYAATKAGADRLAYSYCDTYELPIVIVRPFNNYGPRQHPEKVIPRFITQALSDEPLTIHGDGHASRDWLYVDDDAEAIEAVIAADIDAIAGEVINVATGVDISVSEIADAVLDVLGKPASLKSHVAERLGQVDRHIGSTDKANGCSAGAPGPRSRRAWRAPSSGIATMRPGGGESASRSHSVFSS